ncbi:hypothetical protein PMAYCL1PPCAC_20638, partial [Pristionchus mayeri]
LAASLKCYCTDNDCVPYGACEGNACMVGILKEKNLKITKIKINTRSNFRNVDDKWSALCACEDHFCNTFSYIRQN